MEETTSNTNILDRLDNIIADMTKRIRECEETSKTLDGQDNTQEIPSRIHFIRILSVICKHHGLEWILVGGFIRRLLSRCPVRGSNLDILLKPLVPMTVSLFYVKVNKVLAEMFTLGGFEHPFQKTHPILHLYEGYFTDRDVGYYVSIQAIQDRHTSLFRPMYTSDELVLTSRALQMSESVLTEITPHTLDINNPNSGLCILERLAELRMKQVRMLDSYIYDHGDLQLRQMNANMMKREHDLMEQGITPMGGTLVQSKTLDPCPICLDTKNIQVKIFCGHSFCIPCLATHIQSMHESSTQCPLCRSNIQLVTE